MYVPTAAYYWLLLCYQTSDFCIETGIPHQCTEHTVNYMFGINHFLGTLYNVMKTNSGNTSNVPDMKLNLS